MASKILEKAEEEQEADSSEINADLKVIEKFLLAGFRTPGSALDKLAQKVPAPGEKYKRKEVKKVKSTK